MKASLRIALYSVRSERAFCEELEYNLPCCWFLEMDLLERSFDATIFTKNRPRWLEHDEGRQHCTVQVSCCLRVQAPATPSHGALLSFQSSVPQVQACAVRSVHVDVQVPTGLRVEYTGSQAHRDFVPAFCQEATVSSSMGTGAGATLVPPQGRDRMPGPE